jgi:hypothetical protein
MGYVSSFVFTKNALTQNHYYISKWCGIIIFASTISIVIINFLKLPILIPESFVLISFGVSWLTEGFKQH